MNKEDYLQDKYGRYIESAEIIIEFDNCPETEIAVYDVLSRLLYAGYSTEMWQYKKPEGKTGTHLHIKNIEGLAELEDNIGRRYKELFLKNYVGKEFFPYVDISLCGKHRIATETKPHWKYGTNKLQVAHYNKCKTNRVEDHIVRRAEIEIAREKIMAYKQRVHGNGDILQVADELGIGVTKNRMAICPFHPDRIPSLMLYEDGHYHCFGCGAHGWAEDLRAKIKGG